MKQASTEAVARISSRKISADEMRRIVQITPSRLVDLKGKQRSEDARLIIRSIVPEQESTEEHIADLCSELSSAQSRLRDLPSDTEIDIWCTIYSEGEFVGLALEHALLTKMAKLGVNLIISYYERSSPT